MEVTLEMIGILIWRGWEITFVKETQCYRYRSPDGVSGCDYTSARFDFETFPPAVGEWVLDNVPMTHAERT